MYPSLRDLRGRRADHLPGGQRWWRPVVTANVAFLGLTSLLTDISSEMVTSVIPLFLTFQLGFSPLSLGIFNGAFQATSALAALAGAAYADRHRRFKEVAGIGYGISAVMKIGLVAARHSWVPATALLYADRGGKGLRTAPRDALLSLSAVPGHVGEAFGVHRAMDTVGAVAGPLVAFALLSLAPDSYSTIFVASFWIALVGLAVLVLFVENRSSATPAPTGRTVALRTAVSLLRLPDVRRLVLAGGVLRLATIGDALVYLTFQRRSSMETRFFPLLYVGTAIGYVLLALPMGRLADRLRPARVFLAGQVMLLGVDVVLLRTDPGPTAMVVMLASLGIYYAATDGVLAAVASSVLPDQSRASGLALLGAVLAGAELVGSVVFGALWQWRGPGFAVGVFLVGLLVALVAGFGLLRPLLAAGPAAGAIEAPR